MSAPKGPRGRGTGRSTVGVRAITPRLSRYDLYELCVQSPRHAVALLRAIHGLDPVTLAEDFSGTAAISRRWLEISRRARAIATDRDPAPLRRAGCRTRLRTVCADVTRDPPADKADVIFVGNFSIGEIHQRAALVRYLRRCRGRLNPRGVFICDTYGGESAYRLGGVERRHAAPDGSIVRYTWEQRKADPLTGEVENALHFRVERRGEIVQELTDAFVYRWRLWSVPSLREAMHEAGFKATEVYDQVPGGVDQHGEAYVHPITNPDELDASFIVCVAGRR